MRRIAAAVMVVVIVGSVVFAAGGCASGKKGKAQAPPALGAADARWDARLRPENSPGDRLANSVMKASGAPRWGMVRVVAFRYVEREGERVVASGRHVWDLVGGVDTVTTAEGVTTSVNVANADVNDPAQAAGLRAWAGDTHWLVAPMRLGAGGGAVLEYGGSATVNGKAMEILRVRFESERVMPGWRYQWYVDPLTSLVMYCDEIPEGNPETRRRVTWEGYRNLGPFKLPTLHRFVGDVRSVAIEELRVEW